jgi:hypothetical protein
MEPAEYTGEVVRLALLAGDDAEIRNLTFTDCDIKGPAVVYFQGGETNNCRLAGPDLNAIFWEIPPTRSTIVGAVLVANCKFFGCRFEGVGFAGTAQDRETLRKELRTR